ncbi:TRAP transporter small permease [Pelagibacterium montanilacus]|uniref:TRAP transporter small permease n=1 Tax=Pelagibacterium montanilacus TaxID=2185280 RepID=UPI000F8F7506|nr:TRAP transporter small permease [Pelagibacterium montanilacus]
MQTRDNPVSRFVRAVDRAAGWIDVVLQLVMISVLAGIFLLMISQVLLRYVVFVPIPWIEELAAMLLPVLAVWGSAICIRHNSHLKVDFIVEALARRLKLTIYVLINALIVFLAFKICEAGLALAELGRNEMTTSRSISLYWPRMAIVVGGALIMIQAGVLILKDAAQIFDLYRPDLDEPTQ